MPSRVALRVLHLEQLTQDDPEYRTWLPQVILARSLYLSNCSKFRY